jgi:DNA-binding CsgD family transcriptional regulator
MNPVAEDILIHYGMPKRSGRYPYGSGDNPYQHSGDFLSRIEELKKQGLNDTEIARSMGLTTTQYRAQKSLAKDERRALDVATAKGLREKGYSLNEIAAQMGFKNDSSVRSLLNENSEARMNQAKQTADILKKLVDEKGMIDVGKGAALELGISQEKLKQALYILEEDGYLTYGGGVPQATNPGKQTNLKVLCPPGTEHKEIYQFDKIHSIREYHSEDGGMTFERFEYPKSMDSKRLKIRYAEEGGIDKDGVVEIRRGVEDISLGDSKYAQVRILVDGTHYIKGMAVYSDNLPDGVDMVFNTNKKLGTPMMGSKDNTVLKNIKSDPDNPFGSLISANGQRRYIDADGNKQLSLINKTREEGDWNDWSDKLPSQFLSKQSLSLAKKQLSLAAADKQTEYDEICSLNNPTVKKRLLKSFADDCDAAAVHLQAASLPRQKYHVILPVKTMKDTEVYAPNYEDGEQVALIRYPHGGTFEIPILTVNNKHSGAKKMMGNAMDAVGINSKVAERLSGADFDGDTVMVIPTGKKVKIASQPPLKGLEGFDPKAEYPYREGMKTMKNTQTEMGKISNLITDMTLKGAKQDELARAVRHSMVVIDAEKHRLDYKQSERDNGIASLKKKYQGNVDAEGRYHENASTIISRASSETSVLKRQGQPKVNQRGKAWYDPTRPEGALLYKSVTEEYVDKRTGKTVTRMQKSTKMAEVDDAYTLVSDADTPMERAYADYANKMKSLGNQARKEMVTTGKIEYSSSAKATYKNEVDSLEAKLRVSLMNAPRERQAQVMANAVVNAKKQDNPDMTKSEIKKASTQALNQARLQVGAKRTTIDITDREWEAIQAGAISETKLTQILNHTDVDKIRQRATPRNNTKISTAKANKIEAMKASGYTNSQIANAIGVSTSTVSNYLRGKE